MNLRPYTIARYGVYVALAIAALSVWIGKGAGATLDYALLRAVFVFILFTALGFGADAALTLGWLPPLPPPPAPEREPGQNKEGGDQAMKAGRYGTGE